MTILDSRLIDPQSAAILLGSASAVVLSGGAYIRLLQRRMFGQYIREDGPQHHQRKAGTPTGGGVLILGGMILALMAAWLFGDRLVFTPELWLVAALTLVLGLLGFSDDYLKIAKRKNKGLSGYSKLAIQIAAGLAVGIYVMMVLGRTWVPVFNGFNLELGWAYPLFAALVIVGASNAVNLTDGLDGLAGGTSAWTLLALFIIFQNSLYGEWAPVYPDLALAALALLAGTLGFLYFNVYPARLFMGDTGSLALGGAIGALAVLGQMETWLLLLGGVFVAEALSVILQVASFKTTGRRIFKMSPLHHHFELCGWPETVVVTVFVVAQFLLCALVVVLYNGKSWW